MKRLGVGIVGLGNISGAYLTAAKMFDVLDIVAVADMNPATAAAKAAEHGLRAVGLDAIFDDPAVDIILNLTVPKAHVEVGLRALAAGKHVYSEKPLGVALADGQRLIAAADARGLSVGSAPDTFLGAGHQTARALVDGGALGQPVGGTAFFMCPGHERWHPAPAFYYETGGGPMLDMGPYYITDLVNLLGPVAWVSGAVTRLRSERVILSDPKKGQVMPVEVPTHVTGTLGFANGALVQVAMSFDVAGHRHEHLELYGTEGALIVPDPNRFGGVIQHKAAADWVEVVPDLPYGGEVNYRSIGLADMAHAILSGRPHRASGALALHVLEVMEAFATSSDRRAVVDIDSRVDRPEPLASSLVDGVLAR